ncbi:AAA family ATPase [Capnocytophaga cynodegmi]|uniref:AAA family ATPase n=1 Tax=Capnocytophaga cynodegmi TaxID=28189 RepID=UPI001BB43D0D
METLEEKIKALLEREEIKKQIDSSEFYFEKGRQVLKVFEQLSVTDEVKTYLINNKKNYTFLKDKFENYPDYKEIGRLIFTIISYCDSNAYKKATYNEYEDKRVLALAFVRMNNWAEQLISYKFEYDNDIRKLPIGSIRNAIAYLKKPSENFTMLSENHRRQVTERLFNKEYTSENFAKYFSDFFEELKITPKNADNLTAILSEICYLMKEEWLIEDAKEFVKDMNLEKTLDLLKYKKQIILQGPPGTGKTREAKILARELIKFHSIENKIITYNTLTQDIIKSNIKEGQRIKGKDDTNYEVISLKKILSK